MDKEDIFKKIMYLFMTAVISLSGYDIVKKDNPEVTQKLIELSHKVQLLDEKFNIYITKTAKLSDTMEIR